MFFVLLNSLALNFKESRLNKVFITISGVLAALLLALFFMYRSVSKENTKLEIANQTLTANLTAIQNTLNEKLAVIDKQNKRYQEVINSIQYNECESLPVSPTLVEAAKELQK